MSLFNQVSGPADGAAVFLPMPVVWAWDELNIFSIGSAENSAAITTLATSLAGILEEGDKLRVINGDYAGVYTIIEVVSQAIGVRFVLDTPYIGNRDATGSTLFSPEVPAEFQIISGYSTGLEATVKPWGVSSEIGVAPSADGKFRFDISAYLRKEFNVSAPLVGPHPQISLRYLIRQKTASAIPDDTGSLRAYYGLNALSPVQLDGSEAVGDRPVLFFGGAPTLYSLAGGKGIINNYIASPGGAGSVGGAVVDLQLLSCEARELTWGHTGPTEGFITDPALPSWIEAAAVGDTIELTINPCSAGVGDYLAADYNPLDYLTGGELNSVTGCYSFDFSLGGSALFTLNICVSPVSEIVEVCAKDVINFAWLNSRGGFSSFALDCRAIYGRDFGGETTVIDADRVFKRTEYREVYDTVEVRAGVLSKNQMDFLTDLRSAVQAFIYNEDSGEFDTPIVIDRQSFTTYENRFNQAETRVAFSFKKAAQIRTQTQ